ncbi:hypothetical protein NM208_g8869 [Fusarium decemcellulare]|uniref:Uncharacterized protein n=1 Tax=Fusarium decemcellulare TaxID=57161 RepID=A0ACC1S3Z5_9HYPO|nr:hypothetical protein NM208_g8869 [Fusarium decemcellulare]
MCHSEKFPPNNYFAHVIQSIRTLQHAFLGSIQARSLLHRAPSTRIHHVLRPIPVPQCSRTLSTTSLARSEEFASQKESPWIPSPEVQSPQTLTEKIVQRYAVGLPQGKVVRSGDYISLAPEFCMSHDNSWPIATKFMSIGATQINRPDQIVMTLDHDVQNTSPANLQKYQKIEAFAKQQGTAFFPAGRGIGHQIMVEEFYAWPVYGRLREPGGAVRQLRA